jgi:hypothetical protein
MSGRNPAGEMDRSPKFEPFTMAKLKYFDAKAIDAAKG